MQTTVRSPLFYVGDKYKLMPQLSELFPAEIVNYVEPFVGGGSSFLNTQAKNYYLNDLNTWIIKIHQELNAFIGNDALLINQLYGLIDEYGLTCTFRGIDVPLGYRQKYKKTYFARANKESYMSLRRDFNADKSDILRLYVLLIYGFNHMIRFNAAGDFNLPVGNVDFNKNVYSAILSYLRLCAEKKPKFFSQDYRDFIGQTPMDEGTYIYFDPPYLISNSEYNKGWDVLSDIELYELIDSLDARGVKFGLTNLMKHKGEKNSILEQWSKKYYVFDIQSNYISYYDNTKKNDSREVFVTNYGGEEV